MPEAEGREADEAAPPMSESPCEAGFHEASRARPEGSFASPKAAPNRRRTRESPRVSSRREAGKGSGPSRDPKRGSSTRLLPSRRAPGERQGLRAAPRSEPGISTGFGPERFLERRDGPSGPAAFERATGGASAPMRARGDGAASAGPDPTREAAARFRSRPGDPAGIGGGLRGLPLKPTGCRTGLRGLAPGSGGKRSGRSRPPRDPKPPSERWPRHPATAVKAGTSGGRWRHRPPL